MFINRNFTSTNFENRQKNIKYVIFHYIEVSFEKALRLLLEPNSKRPVSVHFLIKEDGEIFQLVDEDKIAWHAGQSYWKGDEKINQNSVGIEIDNSGRKEYSEAQIAACLKLCLYLKEKYNIKPEDFLGHSDIAPNRKIDPGFHFPWKMFSRKGFGVWPGQNYLGKINKILYLFGDASDEIKLTQRDLQKFGYKIELTGQFDNQTNFVIRAFLSRFCSEDLKSLGFDYYFSEDSKYQWTEKAQVFLESLLDKVR